MVQSWICNMQSNRTNGIKKENRKKVKEKYLLIFDCYKMYTIHNSQLFHLNKKKMFTYNFVKQPKLNNKSDETIAHCAHCTLTMSDLVLDLWMRHKETSAVQWVWVKQIYLRNTQRRYNTKIMDNGPKCDPFKRTKMPMCNTLPNHVHDAWCIRKNIEN